MKKPKIVILSMSRIPDDPRVRRQGDAFVRQGWDVTGVGLSGARSGLPEWPVRFAAGSDLLDARLSARATRLLSLLRARFGQGAACRAYWNRPGIDSLFLAASELQGDVWLANDWTTLPMAAALAARQDAMMGYDTHELAVEEFAESARWRLLHRPMVRQIEGRYLGSAAVISAVSEGIAVALASHYSLPEQPLVVRNVPQFISTNFRTTGSVIRVLYQGLLSPGRGIEDAIDSAVSWQPRFKLFLRGPGPEAYIGALRARILRAGLTSRVEILPPVLMTDLVSAAAEFDVGLITLPGQSANNLHALPNKFFEYIMAGLALCVIGLPDMASLVQEHGVGVTFASGRPHELAERINALTTESIDQFKKKSLQAAKRLCWEEESRILVGAYANALALRNGAR